MRYVVDFVVRKWAVLDHHSSIQYHSNQMIHYSKYHKLHAEMYNTTAFMHLDICSSRSIIELSLSLSLAGVLESNCFSATSAGSLLRSSSSGSLVRSIISTAAEK